MADMVVTEDEKPHHKGGAAAGPALILYHLFEDPTYFDDWGAKGAPFRFAVREDYLVHHHSSQHAGT